MINRILKKIIAIICIMILILPMTSEVLAKITATNVGDTQIFGITEFHESKYLKGENETKNFGYKVNTRIAYRIYSGENEKSEDAFLNTILCLDQNGDFPGERKTDESNNKDSQNYKNKGNAEEALKNIETSKNGSKQKLSETDIKQIMWIIRNAVLPEDSSDLKDIKLSKIFESEMSKTETTQNPLTLSYIKEILTEDDLVFATQAAIWNITNPQNSPSYYGAMQSENPQYNLLSGNDVETEDGKQGMFVNIIIDYYKANCTSEKDIVITKSEDYTTPVVTGPTEKFIYTNKKEFIEEGETQGPDDQNWIFVGPFKIEGKESEKKLVDYSIDIELKKDDKVLPQTGEKAPIFEIVAVKPSTETKKEPNASTPRFGLTKSELEKNGNQFYIALQKGTSVNNINIKTNCAQKISETEATVWENEDKSMQPLISIKRDESEIENVELNYKFRAKYEREYDIALRKFISSISREESGSWRTIYDSNKGEHEERKAKQFESTEENSFNQYNYIHPKEPIEVQVGDIVKYKIRVYNEGIYNTKITQIADYLPAKGLKLLQAGEYKSKDNGPIHNTIYPDGYKLTETNGADKTIILISPEDGYDSIQNGVLVTEEDCLEVDLEFLVTEDAKGRIITNIAEVLSFVGQEDTNGDENEDGDYVQVTDIDSAPKNVVLPETDSEWENYKGNTNNKKDLSDKKYYYKGQEDDDDFEKIIIPGEKYIDLALRKSITGLNGEQINRQRDPDTRPLLSGEKTSTFSDIKEPPVSVKIGDKVTYTIRVFNEGNQDGYAMKISDYIPEGLGFLPNYKENLRYNWKTKDNTSQTISEIPNALTNFKTEEFDNSKVSYEKQTVICGKATIETDILKDMKLSKFDSSTGKLQIIEIPITCIVLDSKEESSIKRRNIAAITEYADENKTKIDKDRDSVPNNDLTNFDEDNHEDDEDFDVIITEEEKYLDLALRKFITKIGDDNITDRVPKVDTTDLDSEKSTTAKYKHPKQEDIKTVVTGQEVEYTIRVYNEGNQAGYASEIKDDIPEGLEFLPEHQTNKDNLWKMYDKDGNETEDVKKAVSIRTNAKSKENGQEKNVPENANAYFKSNTNIINAYDKDNMDDGPDYVEVKVVFKVVKKVVTDGNKPIINTAEITEETDEDGNETPDRDSVPDNDKPDEDDIDKEYIQLKYFDLSLLKYVSKVIVTEDGVTKETDTGYDGTENPEPVVKVELNKNKLAQTQVKYVYTIKITNEGEIEGYAKEITDRIPAGLYFDPADNKATGWVQKEEGIITTDHLKDTLLKPGESATVQVVLRWQNSETNLGQKVNVAEISIDENEYDIPDIDSTPGNNVDGEDDQDNAIVVLSIKTGSSPLYITLITLVTAIMGTGLYLIYKYVVKK